MKSYPVKLGTRAVRKVAKEPIEVIEPATKANPFLAFRYSYAEISAYGGKAHVKVRKTCFENGKLTAEAFDGDVDRDAYEQMVGRVQQMAANQTALFLKSLALLLPFSERRRSVRD
jgi:hypothetical protein